MLRTPSACAPSSTDSSPAIVVSRGVRCGIVSTPVSRSIATHAMIPLIRARARGLSFTSTSCAFPDSRTARAVASSARDSRRAAGRAAPRRRTRRRRAAARAASAPPTAPPATPPRARERSSEPDGRRFSSTAARIAAICAGVVPQQPPMIAAPSARACAANSPKYAGVACGNTMRCPDMLARPTFGSAASRRPVHPSRRAHRAHAAGPAPWFAPNAATSSAREPRSRARVPRRRRASAGRCRTS